MTAADDWTLVDALADDPAILSALERDAICRAIRIVARSTGGVVTAAQIRGALERPVNPHRIGAVVSGLTRRGVLVKTGRAALSGNTAQRNGQRLMPVFEVADVEAVR